jgi:hypothetical protein
MRFPISLLILFIYCNTPALAIEATCEGSSEAKNHIIYLHGLDTEPSSPSEQATRAKLSEMAQELDLRIAFPRSQDLCPDEALKRYSPDRPAFCWENGDHDTLISRVIEASRACFNTAEPFGVIGFSTGGHLVNRWVLHSEVFRRIPSWFISIATGRRAYRILQDQKIQIQSQSPRITFIYEKVGVPTPKTLASFLSENGAQVNVHEFEGGHYFPPAIVKEALQHLIHH